MSSEFGLVPADADALNRGEWPTSGVETRHLAGLLASIERQANLSQRMLASELGVALGLVNIYIKRCVKKGLIKVHQVPSRRYAYYLTPKGFVEKSRLTAEYLSWSLTFFRQARTDCAMVMQEARACGWRRVALVGGSDLTEIAMLAAAEYGIVVAGLVEQGTRRTHVMGVPAYANVGDVEPGPDGWIVTSIEHSQAHYYALAAQFGPSSVLAPSLLSVHTGTGSRPSAEDVDLKSERQP